MVLNALFFLSSTPFLKNPDSIKDFHLNDVLYLQNIRSSRVSSSIYVDVDNLINKIPETFEDRFTERNISDNEAPANLTKNVCMKIKIGLQYSIILININILITIIWCCSLAVIDRITENVRWVTVFSTSIKVYYKDYLLL